MYAELRRLARGEGLLRGSPAGRIGQQLWFVSEITDLDTREDATEKVTRLIEDLIGRYGVSDQTIARVFLGTDPGASQPTMEQRKKWLATELRCSDSTLRRRVQDVLRRLADDAVVAGRRLAATGELGYEMEALHVDIEIVDDRIAVVQRKRELRAVHPLTCIHCMFGVPPLQPDLEEMFGIEVYGGELDDPRRQRGPAGDVILYGVKPPQPLEKGDRYSFSDKVTCPPGQPMAHHYVVEPRTLLGILTVKVRFDPRKVPTDVWRVYRAQHRQIDIWPPDAQQLQPDSSGIVEVSFDYVGKDGACGLAWTWDT
jgi:hypothetical protein